MKNVLMITVALFALILSAPQANAQAQTNKKQAVSTTKGQNYTDANTDGVCDNRTNRTTKGQNYTDANNDGVCDNRTNRTTKGQNYTDANNDGVCDNRTNRQATGKRNGKGCRGRNR